MAHLELIGVTVASLFPLQELPNGLKVVVIHDATTDKAACSLNVNIGSMADPPEFLGLAHFCEHMLFLGTEKFPTENAYSSFLSEHGGYSNAFTSSSDTNYYFDVAPDHLEGVLDRFFNSENDKNLQSDSWRFHQMNKETGDPDHPWCKFSTGNKDTLADAPKKQGLDTRQALLDFHAKYYSSHIMGLAILGNQTLDELEEMARSRFSEVVRKADVETPAKATAHPHSEAQCRQFIQVVPVREYRQLTMSFPTDDLTLEYTAQPAHYLSHLLGHEGPGSLLSLLKAKGWVNELSAGDYGGEVGCFSFFKISLDLSEEGLDGHLDDIVEVCFQYIAMLQASARSEAGFPKYIFDECQNLNAAYFRYKDKGSPSNYVTSLSKNLLIYPPDVLLTATVLMEDFRPDLIQQVLNKLRPDMLRVTCVSKSFEGLPNMKTEKWYGTQYLQSSFTDEQIARWSSVELAPELHLPPPNAFIASDFTLLPPPAEEASPVPQLVRDSALSKLWYKQDGEFKLPKASISVAMTSPLAYNSPAQCVMTNLFSRMLKDSLSEFGYDAELAGMSYSASGTIHGIDFSVNGYNEKIAELMYAIVNRMVTMQIDPVRFPLIKDQYVRSLKSFETAQPTQLASREFSEMMQEKTYTHAEKLAALEDGITAEMVQTFGGELLRRVHLESLVHGNIEKAAALAIMDTLEGLFTEHCGSKPLLPVERTPYRHYKLRSKETALRRRLTNTHHMSCVDLYLQVGMSEPKEDCILMLYGQLVREPFFEQLRTQEQLGYVVQSGLRRLSGVGGMRFIIQSERSAEYVEERVLKFIHESERIIREMDEETFQNNIDALSTILLEKPKTTTAQARSYWGEITSGNYRFERNIKNAEILRTVTKEDVLSLYATKIALNGPERKQLSVWVQPGPDAPAPPEKAKDESEEGGVVADDTADAADTGSGDGGGGGADGGDDAGAAVAAAKVEELLVNRPPVVEVADVLNFQYGLSLFPVPTPDEHTLVE